MLPGRPVLRHVAVSLPAEILRYGLQRYRLAVLRKNGIHRYYPALALATLEKSVNALVISSGTGRFDSYDEHRNENQRRKTSQNVALGSKHHFVRS